ncbi:HAD family phosphatase [bacterium]|nr:HAD family phosphatase [bacterium]
MDYELLVLDLDGTLLNSEPILTPGVRASILGTRKSGLKVTLATGRMFPAMVRYIEELGIDEPVIALNGAWSQKLGEKYPLFKESMDPQISNNIVQIASKYDVSLGVIEGDRAFMKNLLPIPQKAFSSWIANMLPLKSDSQLDPCEILIAGEDSMINEIYQEIYLSYSNEIAIFKFPSIRYAPMWYLELRGKSCSKGTALKSLAEHLRIDPAKTFVIGDYYNDIPMFEVAGYSVALGNAPEDVKIKAHYVSPFTNDQDAVSQIIREFF